MIRKTDNIPKVTLDEVKKFGVQVVRYSKVDNDHFVKAPHRDEDYLFVFVVKGFLQLYVDFKEIHISQQSIYFILPGQIHQHIDSNIDVIVMAVDSSLVRDVFKSILEDSCFMQNPIQISDSKGEVVATCSTLLDNITKETPVTTYKQHVKQGLIDAILGIITEEYAEISMFRMIKDSRSTFLTKEFRKLLFKKYKELKKPSDYANALNISTPYLNEAVKLTSGDTVTYWIQYMVNIEAKRLLFYTDNSIKQIAYELGYEDQAYFTRMFTKAEKISPQAFRRKYR